MVNFVVSQTKPHNNVWSRLSITNQINSKFKIELETQKRWQNNITAQQNNNPFANQLMNSVRLWTHFKYNSKINFSLSPFAYFQHTSIINGENDLFKKKSYEIRYTVAFDIKEKILNKTYLYNRFGLEFRDFKKNGNDNVIRVRNKLGLKYEFNNKWNLTAFDELFLNLNSKDKEHIYDHNRIGLMGSYNPIEQIKVDFGYIRIDRLQKNSFETMAENNFLVMVYYIFKN